MGWRQSRAPPSGRNRAARSVLDARGNGRARLAATISQIADVRCRHASRARDVQRGCFRVPKVSVQCVFHAPTLANIFSRSSGFSVAMPRVVS